jgi:hypothetical protein
MKRHRYALCLLGLLLLGSEILTAQSSKDFSTFFAKFKTAVGQKDQATLTTLMSPSFAFIRAENVPPAEVFNGLDANGGLQWTNLQQGVQGQPTSYQLKGSSAPARVLQCTTTEPIYSCLVIFQQDGQHKWRWKGMIMPTR